MRICSFASGSRGNCTLVSVNGMNFLIDAGISMRRICSCLALCSLGPGDIDAILITHQHSDHICGLRMLTKHYAIPVYAPRSTAVSLVNSLSCPKELMNVFAPGSAIEFDGVTVRAFPTSHDTEESAGYRIEGDRVFSFATDTGIVTDGVFDGLRGADAVIIESNHDIDMLRYGSYPYTLKKRILSSRGHLSNDDCAVLASKLAAEGTRYIILGHLSRENNTPGKAFAAVKSLLEGRDVCLYVAPEAECLSVEIGGELYC